MLNRVPLMCDPKSSTLVHETHTKPHVPQRHFRILLHGKTLSQKSSTVDKIPKRIVRNADDLPLSAFESQDKCHQESKNGKIVSVSKNASGSPVSVSRKNNSSVKVASLVNPRGTSRLGRKLYHSIKPFAEQGPEARAPTSQDRNVVSILLEPTHHKKQRRKSRLSF